MQIPPPILHEMMSHALETRPEECCGLIVGGGPERFRRLYRCHNEMTQRHNDEPEIFPRDNHSAFYMSPRDVYAVQREAERAGLHVTAVYHSHVGARAYLSEMDLSYAGSAWFPFPEADWIVLAVFERSVSEVAVFRPGRDGFRGHPVAGFRS